MPSQAIGALRGRRLLRLEAEAEQIGWFRVAESSAFAACGDTDAILYAAPFGYDPRAYLNRRSYVAIGAAALAVTPIVLLYVAACLGWLPQPKDFYAAHPEWVEPARILVTTVTGLFLMCCAYEALFGRRLAQARLSALSKIWVVTCRGISAHEVVEGRQRANVIRFQELGEARCSMGQLDIYDTKGSLITSMLLGRNPAGSHQGVFHRWQAAKSIAAGINTRIAENNQSFLELSWFMSTHRRSFAA